MFIFFTKVKDKRQSKYSESGFDIFYNLTQIL